MLVLISKMISAEDVSGAIPVFKKCSEYGKHILEEEEVGTLVLEVSATVKTFDEVEYSLLTNDRFKIDPISGQITTNYKFDRDEPMNEQEELIKVCATNRNNHELKGICDIKIVIDDINDNPPIFQQTPYHSTVLINSTINDVIFKVKATDIDQGENTINVYLTNSDVFSIDSDGTLYLAKNIDKKLGDFYSFTVHAFNQNKASNSDRSLVTLTVIDGSENHSTQTTTVESSLLSNDNTDIDYNDDLDEDNEDGNSNNSFQRSEEANDQTTDKMSSLLKVDAEVHEDEIRSTTFKSKQTTIAQVTVKINLLSNNDAEVDKLNEDETLITTLESEQTTIAQKIDVNNTLLNNTDTEVDKDNDGSMNESIISDGNFTYITTMIARFLMQDFNLFAIVALIIIILLIILVCSYCFCRSKLISHDFISTDNSLYFFGSDKRDSFNMVETKAMNNYGN